MKEEWKLCTLNDNYLISNLGNIKNIKKNKNLNPSVSNRGYISVRIRVNLVPKLIPIHKLIMLAFKQDEYFDGAEVNHIDGNKLNNKLDNLEWVTHQRNVQHAHENNLIHTLGVDKMSSKLSEDQVLEIRKLFNEGKTQTELSKIYSVSQYNISLIVNNKMWKHIHWEPKPPKPEKIKTGIHKGENRNFSKLTEEQVLEIRKLYPEVKNYTKLAKQFNVSDNNIKKIVLRQSWTRI